MPSISFAIPTYNFGAFIAQTVDSIFAGFSQASSIQVEVVIVDGASSDDTPDRVAQLQARYPNVRYERRLKRGGIDFDLNHALSLCQHDYVWMLSADDVLQPDWPKVLLPLLEEHQPDAALVPAVICALDMSQMRRNHIFHISPSAKFHLYELNPVNSGVSNLNVFLQQALTLEALFSFMSAVIVKRSVWNALPERPDRYGSCWAHCSRLMPLLVNTTHHARVLYLNEHLLSKRMGNDSFMENGLVRRLGITVDGWHQIIQEFFPKPEQHRLAWRLVRLDASIFLYGYAKVTARSPEEGREFMRLARILYLENHPSLASRFQYALLWLSPRLPQALSLLKRIVPQLNRWRHQIRGIFAR